MDFGHDLSQALAHNTQYGGELSFARRQYTRSLEGADIAVVGIPFDLGTSNRPGARLGPRAIREQSSLVGCYPWGPWPWDFNVFERCRVIDYSDITFLPGYTDRMLTAVDHHVGGILAAGVSVLALGGDHTVSYPLLRAHARRHGPLSLVHFDAHSDTWDMGDDIVHGTPFFLAANEGLIDPSRSIQVGIRTPHIDPPGITVVDVDELLDQPLGTTVERIRAVVGEHPTYLTVDIDFLDPAYAPGTGTPVVGGPTTRDARRLMQGLRGLNVVGADLVEVAPPFDSGAITALAGATLAHDLLYLLAEGRAARGTTSATG